MCAELVRRARARRTHLSPGRNADVGPFLGGFSEGRRRGHQRRPPRRIVHVSHPLLGRARVLAQPCAQLEHLRNKGTTLRGGWVFYVARLHGLAQSFMPGSVASTIEMTQSVYIFGAKTNTPNRVCVQPKKKALPVRDRYFLSPRYLHKGLENDIFWHHAKQ